MLSCMHTEVHRDSDQDRDGANDKLNKEMAM